MGIKLNAIDNPIIGNIINQRCEYCGGRLIEQNDGTAYCPFCGEEYEWQSEEETLELR